MTRSIGYLRRTPGSLHDVLSRAFDQAGGVSTVADILPGRTSKRLYEASNELIEAKHATRLYLDEARLLGRMPGVDAFAVDFALLAGGMFVPGLDRTGHAIGAQAGRAGRESGEAMCAIFDALSDGVLSRAEAELALPQIREAVAAYSELYRMVQAVIEPPAPAETQKP